MRAVEIIPVDLPAISASSNAVTSSLPATVLHSPRSISSSTPITPTSVFTPLIMAVMVPAESGVCASTLYVLDNPENGNLPKLSWFSSPSSPFNWPSRIRAAVMVEMPMPSPTNRITFFALPRRSATIACNSSSLAT